MLPRGVEEVMFSLLEKSPNARPNSATEVCEKLTPFRPAADRVRPGKTTSRTDPGLGTPPVKTASHVTSPPRTAERSDTRPSGPSPTAEAPKPRTDTIALVERATRAREMSNAMAIALIVLLSIVAGLATYVIRVRADAPSLSGTATAAAKRPLSPSSQ